MASNVIVGVNLNLVKVVVWMKVERWIGTPDPGEGGAIVCQVMFCIAPTQCFSSHNFRESSVINGSEEEKTKLSCKDQTSQIYVFQCMRHSLLM